MVVVLKLRSVIMLIILEKYVSYSESYLKDVDIQKVVVVLIILIKRGNAYVVCGKTANECHVDGLVQERRNSTALAMKLRLSCTNPSMYGFQLHLNGGYSNMP